MRVVGVIVALAGALALQTTLAGLTIGGATAVNLVLVAVIYVALAFGPVAGLLAGSAGGIVQDALAGGIVGVGGFSKTLVGFLVGLLGAQFIVAQSFPRLVMFVSGTVVHELCYQALYALVEARAFRMPWSAALAQAVVNGLIGILAFQIVETGPGLMQRRRARGATLSRRRY
jgi:rod shape-determining protein MreD